MPRRKKSARNQITNKPAANDGASPNDADEKPKTPYQGSDQAFGMFKCHKCNRFWTSNVSWANCGQMCKKCKIFIYPHLQLVLESEGAKKLNKSNPRKRHPQEFCEKCKELGTYCAQKPQIRGRRRRRRTAYNTA